MAMIWAVVVQLPKLGKAFPNFNWVLAEEFIVKVSK